MNFDEDEEEMPGRGANSSVNFLGKINGESGDSTAPASPHMGESGII